MGAVGCGQHPDPMNDYFVGAMYPVRLDQVCDRGEKLVQVMVGCLLGPENPGVSKKTVPSGINVPSGAYWSRSLTAFIATKTPLPSVRNKRRTFASLLDRLKT